MRGRREVEFSRQQIQRRFGLVAVNDPAGVVHPQALARVLLGGLDEASALSPDGNREFDRATATLPQHDFEVVAVGGLEGQQHHPRHVRRVCVELRKECRQHIRVGGVLRAVEHERVGVGDHRAADEEHLHARLVLRSREREHVGIEARGRRHLLALCYLLDRRGLIA